MSVARGLLGVVTVLGIAFLFSNNKRNIKLRPILGGLAILFVFAFLVLGSAWGIRGFEVVVGGVNGLMEYAGEGIDFLFGGLYTPESGITFVVAFNVLPHIIFFAGLIAVLYHLRVMPVVTRYLGGGIQRLLGTSRTESLSAASNIFVGHTEAPLTIRPYLATMTGSELFAVMVGGLASVAGTMFASYIALGVPAQYVLAAMFMAAPAGIVIAKTFYPQTESVADVDRPAEPDDEDDQAVNIVDAAANGARRGLNIALTVGAILLTFVALVAVVNGVIGQVGGWFGADLSLQGILGYALAPLAFALGVPWSESLQAGSFIGEKFFLTEFVAYSSFAEVMDSLSPKTVTIVSFALCGFANLGSMGSLIGVLGNLIPDRRREVARMALRSVFAGMLASMLSASIAGMFV